MPPVDVLEADALDTAASLDVSSSGSSTNPERSAATRAKLIAATTEALYRYGYAATTTILVAKLAKVSRGAMLHHYPNKVALILACMEATFEAEMAYYRQHLGPITDPQERILALVDAAWECFRAPSGVARTEIWLASRSDPELASHVRPKHQADVQTTQMGMARLAREAGINDEAFVSSFLTLAVGTFRGLAMSAALGVPQAELSKAVNQLKDILRRKIRESS